MTKEDLEKVVEALRLEVDALKAAGRYDPEPSGLSIEDRRAEIARLESAAQKIDDRLAKLWSEDVEATKIVPENLREKILEQLEDGDWEPLSTGFHDQVTDRGLMSQPDEVVIMRWFRAEGLTDPRKFALFVEDPLWEELSNNLQVVGMLSEFVGRDVAAELAP